MSSISIARWAGLLMLAAPVLAAEVDQSRRADFLRRAANIEALGSSGFSHYMVGVSYLQGREIERDEAEAVRWFRKAALMGDRAGQRNLILAYREGMGVARDAVEARAWALAIGEVESKDIGPTPALAAEAEAKARARAEELRRLIAQGEAQADARAAQLRREIQAQDLARDRPLALKGDAAAQRRLGIMYLSGDGVAPDPVEGAAWLRLAEAAGDADARKQLANLRSSLTSAQADQSTTRASELRRQIAPAVGNK